MEVYIIKPICAIALALALCLGFSSTVSSSGHIQLVKDFPAADLNSSTNPDASPFEVSMPPTSSSAPVRDYWPTTGWRYSSGEEQGMNSTMLAEMMEYIRNEEFMLDSVVVVRNGYVVLEEYPRPNIYGQNTTHNLYSCTKSFTSMLIGIALKDGYVDNVQHKLVDFFPNRDIDNMDSRKQAITLENVLTMTSGLQWDEWTYSYDDPRNSVRRMVSNLDWVQFVLDLPMTYEPGTVWTYNSGGSHVLSAIINETTGINPWTFARERLLDPLGITVGFWSNDYQGLPNGHSNLHIRPLDMAKLGFLYLNEGAWDGEQIVQAEWVNASAQVYYPVFPGIDYYYGYQWWMRPLTGYYWAWGTAGQTIAVIPDYDMVVVFTGSVTNYDPGPYLISNYILPAATTPPIVVPDDFPTIQKAINSADDGDTIFVKAGTYYEHVVVNKTLSLLGENSSTTVVDGNWTGVVINVTRNDVTIAGLTIQRSGSQYWENAGILLDNVKNCSIIDNIIRENSFVGIELNYSLSCSVSGNSILSNSGAGVTLVGGGFHDLSTNSFANNSWSALTVNEANHNTISENNMTSNDLAVLGHCINLYRSSNNSIQKNRIADDDNGIRLEYWSNFNKLYQNNIINNAQTGVSIERYSDNNTISENMISGSRIGIALSDSTHTWISQNTIAHNYGSDWDAGVHLRSAADTMIYDNNITDNHYGILLYSNSPRVSVCANNVTENDFGIRVANGGSNYFNVAENVVANNINGIAITGFGGGSNYATIARNIITNNFDGILLGQYSNYNMIFQNNISHHVFGFFIEYSSQNTIWGNNLVDNDQQVNLINGSINHWNSSYVSGGNFWSEHFSWDIFSGPFQNETGSDGIGDAPYEIDENNIDYYPYVSFRLPADINDDGYVGIDDLFFIASNFGREKGQVDWNPMYDINSDAQVNIGDIYIAACHFGDSI